LELYERTLLQLQQSGLEGEHLAITKNAIALVLFHSLKSTVNADKTFQLFEESLKLYEKLVGNKEKEIATVANHVGRVHFLSGNYLQALIAYERALKIRRRLYKRYSIDLAVTICNLGQTCHQLGKLDEAMTLPKVIIPILQSLCIETCQVTDEERQPTTTILHSNQPKDRMMKAASKNGVVLRL
jgi:tetratricopeptide (TPR) repeat protein